MSVPTVEQPTKAPTQKVSAVAAAGALTTVIVFVAKLFDLDISQEAAAAITTLVAFSAGYLKGENARTNV